jgi:phenylpropionate dioxygenase-like ring-hydroxylating dioxygenase large terminal subunit
VVPSAAVDSILRRSLRDEYPDVTEAVALPKECYTSREFFEFELATVFSTEWLCLGRLEQVPTPGDYLRVDVADDPLIVLRDDHAEIRVLSAVCAHRSMVIVEGRGNCGRRLVCPYHWLTYDLL